MTIKTTIKQLEQNNGSDERYNAQNKKEILKNETKQRKNLGKKQKGNEDVCEKNSGLMCAEET